MLYQNSETSQFHLLDIVTDFIVCSLIVLH